MKPSHRTHSPLGEMEGLQTVPLSTLELLTLIEGKTVTGPAKLLLDFCRRAAAPDPECGPLPSVRVTLATYCRDHPAAIAAGAAPAPEPAEPPNTLVAAACAAGAGVEILHERFRFDPRVLCQLRRLVERRAPDVLESQHVKSHFLVRLSGLYRERPWVAFHHGYTTTDRKMRVYNQLDRWSLRKADCVVTVCRAFARDLIRLGVRPDRIRVLHSAIETEGPNVEPEETGALRARLGIDGGQPVLLTVGRLSREKGHADLVMALDHLRRADPGLCPRLVLVGDGPERERIARMAAALGVEDRVRFAGHVRDVRPFYAIATALALPSHSEGSPNVLLEAMAAGVPIATTAVGGIPEIVTHRESALLVPPRDPRAMAAALGALLTRPELARTLAANARTDVAARHAIAARCRALCEIYSQVTVWNP